MGKLIPLKPYKHDCTKSRWKPSSCKVCDEHRVKLIKHLKESRWRAKCRKEDLLRQVKER